MKNIKVISLNLFVLFLLTACGKASLEPKAYYNWVKDEINGLTKTKVITPLKIELQYQPGPFLVVNNLRKEVVDKAEFEEKISKFQDLQYFEMKMGIDGSEEDIVSFTAKGAEQRDGLVNYLSYGMQQDIKLVEGKDTLACALFHFEKSYDLTKERTFLLAFEKQKDSDNIEKTFILDSPIWGTGPIKIVIERKDLLKVPTIKLQS